MSNGDARFIPEFTEFHTDITLDFKKNYRNF